MGKRESQSAEERKMFVLAREIGVDDDHPRGLEDDERIELAQILLRRDITSWTQLEPHQVVRLLDAMEGYQLITALLEMRAPSAPPQDPQH